MPIDKYQPCPCGSGKKIKFCCSADIVGELEKIQRMLDGEQRRACLEHVNHVLEKHPDRPSLLSIKAMLETELGDTEHAEETVKSFLQQSPDNPVALAEQARLLTQEAKPREATEALQSALDACEGTIASRIFSALGDVAGALLQEGRVLAARAHLLLHASLGGEQDSRGAELLMHINGNENIPLLLRQDAPFAPCADDAPYAAAFRAAMDLIGQARWRAALVQLEDLAERHGREACIRRNIAILRGFLGRDAEAAKAWRKYAVLVESESLDDAVEAEALAQLLDDHDAAESIDLLDVTYEIKDLDRVMEVLLAAKRTPSMPVDLASLASDDQPAPKAVFSLLDRDMPESGKDLSLEAAPRALCDFYVFGRETDKPPRLEFSVNRRAQPAAHDALVEVCGEWIEQEPKIEVVDQTNALEEAMTWAWRLPEDTPREIREKLHEDKQQSVLLDVWPTIPQHAIDGKAPEQVQDDAKYRVRLLAAILLLELHGQQNRWRFDYNQLRNKLGLPTGEPIDPDTIDIAKLPLVRYPRLDASKLPTDKLADAFQYAALMQAPAAIRNLGETLAQRDDSQLEYSRANIYGILARTAQDNAEALSYIEKAREAAVEKNESPARWLLAELPLQIESGNAERAQELVNRIQAKHQRETGVMQSLLNILVRYGLIDPYAAGAPGAGAGAAPAPPPTSPAAADTGIWTPGGATSAMPASPSPSAPSPETKPAGADESGGESSKSGLWLPGMD